MRTSVMVHNHPGKSGQRLDLSPPRSLTPLSPSEENQAAERAFVSDVLQWPLKKMLPRSRGNFAVPRKEDLEMLTVGEKLELSRCMQQIVTTTTVIPSTMFDHVYSTHMQKVTALLQYVYKLPSNERGHTTTGHKVVTAEERREAQGCHSSLLYGELMPSAVTKMLGDGRLEAAKAEVLYDLGMGLGKAAVQAFLALPNLKKVVGVEFAQSRSLQAMDALRVLAKTLQDSETGDNTCSRAPADRASQWLPRARSLFSRKQRNASDLLKGLDHTTAVKFEQCQDNSAATLSIASKTSSRSLELRHQNLFLTLDAKEADIVILETEIPKENRINLCVFLSKLKISARLLSYENLEEIFASQGIPCPFVRLQTNTTQDRYFTTWAYKYGHRFHLWRKV